MYELGDTRCFPQIEVRTSHATNVLFLHRPLEIICMRLRTHRIMIRQIKRCPFQLTTEMTTETMFTQLQK